MKSRRTTGRPANYSIETIARVADSVIPVQPDRHDNHRLMRTHREMLMVGMMHEMAFRRPSYPEMALVLGLSHSTCMLHLQSWRELDWRERYGWLTLMEGRLAHETNPVDAVLL